MFWHSILGSFSLLTHWQFWMFCILFPIFYVNLKVLVGINASEYESEFLYKSRSFAFLMLEGITVCIFTAFLIPILFGKSELTPVSAIFSHILLLLIVGAIAGVATYFALKWSIVGTLITDLPGVVIFIEALTLCINFVNNDYGSSLGLHFHLPSFWYSIGYFVAFIIIAIVLVGITMFLLEMLGVDIGSTLVKMLVMQTAGFFAAMIGISMLIHHIQSAGISTQ